MPNTVEIGAAAYLYKHNGQSNFRFYNIDMNRQCELGNKLYTSYYKLYY